MKLLHYFMALTILTACSGKNDRNAAIFESFIYSGHDSGYDTDSIADDQFLNPILPGWYSDPSVTTNGNGDYYLVTSTFSYFPGVPLFYSRDLMNWKQIGHVLDRPSQLRNLEHQHASGGIFAPAIAFNPVNETYYMITTNVGDGNFFVKTKDPLGSWSDPIMLPDIHGIDPSFFFDDDGRAYIVNNDDAPGNAPEYDGHRTIRITEFDVEGDSIKGETKILVNKGVNPEEKPIWCEGPHMYKRNGYYYLMTAEGGTAENHCEVIYRSKSPWGPFIPWENNPILTQRDLTAGRENPVTCTGHADLINKPDGSTWAFFLGCRPIEGKGENLGRETFLLPVEWTSDGWPLILPQGEAVPLTVTMPGVKREADATFGNFTVTDNFNDSVLTLQWLTLRGPATEYYSLKRNPGTLTIDCAPIGTTEMSELPFVGRRIQHHNFDATAVMSFVPGEGEQAGLMVYKDESHQYLFVSDKTDDKKHIAVKKVSPEGITTIGYQEAEKHPDKLQLRVSGDGNIFSFAFSTDNGNTWQKVAEAEAYYTTTANAGGFTGTLIGPFANKVY